MFGILEWNPSESRKNRARRAIEASSATFPGMRRRRVPALLLGDTPFPDPDLADDEGLIAVGGDLAPARLLAAYDCGIFPWYDDGLPVLWWSPNPRAILERDGLHISTSMRRALRRGGFQVSCDRAFREVLALCADRSGGTWILPEVTEAYCRLHELGHAHSFEVWKDEALVGGLYGVHRGGLFAAESMFHRVDERQQSGADHLRAEPVRRGHRAIRRPVRDFPLAVDGRHRDPAHANTSTPRWRSRKADLADSPPTAR